MIKAHPAVFDALVVGVPDERFGERVVAVRRRARPGTADARADDELDGPRPGAPAGLQGAADVGPRRPRAERLPDRQARLPRGRGRRHRRSAGGPRGACACERSCWSPTVSPRSCTVRDVPDPVRRGPRRWWSRSWPPPSTGPTCCSGGASTRARRWRTRSRAWSSAVGSPRSGERATLWAIGDEVMGIVGGGAYAERIAVHERQLMAVPATVAAGRRRRHPRGVDHRLRRAGRAGRAHVRAHRAGARRRRRAWAPPPSRSPRPSGPGSSSPRRPARSTAASPWVPTRPSTTRAEDFVGRRRTSSTGGAGVDVVLDVIGGDYVDRNIDALRRRAAGSSRSG